MNKKVRLLEVATPLLVVVLLVASFIYVERAKSNINATYNNLTGVTSANNFQPVLLATVGDIACDPVAPATPGECQEQKTAELITKMNPDGILALGDLQYQSGELDKFRSGFDAHWGKLKNNIFPTPGNHEYVTKDAAGYFAYFSDDTAAINSSEILRGYYSFDFGGWHFISLNSNCDKTNDCTERSAQIEWLKTDLEKNKLACTIAFWHHPRFTSGNYYGDQSTASRSDQFWQTLQADNAEVILNGHDHLYERFARQDDAGMVEKDGIRQFTVGTGGRSLYSVKHVSNNSEKIVSGKYGVLFLKLYLGSYQWQFVDIDGKALDEGRSECNI